MSDLQTIIDTGWDRRDSVSADDRELAEAVREAIHLLDSGEERVAQPDGAGGWQVNQWLKKAVLLSFRLNPMTAIPGGPGGAPWWDKVDSKFLGWGEDQFKSAAFRAVPGAIVRRGAHVAKGAVLMPSFANIGAYVGEGAMIDTWATVGSCAQIGKNVHLSGGAGSVASSSRYRPNPSSSRTTASSARAAKSPRASSSKRARSCRWACSSPPRPRSSTAIRDRSTWDACPPIRWWCRGRCRAARGSPTSPVP